jgi:hypothetical protein
MGDRLPDMDGQFVTYYDKLRNELNKAYTHYEISKCLKETIQSHNNEFNEATTFFTLTIDAHLFATIMSISRFTDMRGDSLHLNIFFKFVTDNINIFSVENFKRRLRLKGADIEYCEHWAAKHTDITGEMVRLDKARFKSLPIANIRAWRDKKIAHIEKDLVLKNVDVMKENPVKIHEIDDIIGTFHEMLNRYRIAFDGTEWAIGLPAVDRQIIYIMDALRFYRQRPKNSNLP